MRRIRLAIGPRIISAIRRALVIREPRAFESTIKKFQFEVQDFVVIAVSFRKG